MSVLAGIPKRQYTTILTDDLEALQAENVRLHGGGWLPIESAPKDGTKIIVFRPNHTNHIPCVGTDYWGNGDIFKIFSWRKSNKYHQPTHWQPLPLPPKPEGEPDAARA